MRFIVYFALILLIPAAASADVIASVDDITLTWDDVLGMIVFDNLPGETEKSLQVFVNPKILESDGEIISEDEGCLSVPDFRSNVKRSSLVLVEGIDREGNPIKIEVEGYLAIVLQHEIDHLNGILFIDRISSLKRELYKRRIKKQLREK